MEQGLAFLLRGVVFPRQETLQVWGSPLRAQKVVSRHRAGAEHAGGLGNPRAIPRPGLPPSLPRLRAVITPKS